LITIAITNRQRTLSIDRRRMRRAIQAIVRDSKITEARISIAVVDDATIAKLHDQFLNDPEPTDVLSFVLERSTHVLEGEVVVSADTAQAYAAQYDCTPEDELMLYVIHGTLHLVGFDDTTPRKRAVMRKKEKEYLNFSRCPPKKPLPS
jgi:probable rRNA maturation factor